MVQRLQFNSLDPDPNPFKTNTDPNNCAWLCVQGLRIAPPEAPVTGYMFGKGIYFADMVSKSANYCCTNKTNNTGTVQSTV